MCLKSQTSDPQLKVPPGGLSMYLVFPVFTAKPIPDGCVYIYSRLDQDSNPGQELYALAL